MMRTEPYLFDEFFASGKEESVSPFLTPDSRKWGRGLNIKSAVLSALLLAIAFALSFYNEHLSHVLLIPVYFFAGTPALIDALEDLKSFEINIDVLMTLAALLSVVIGSEMEGALLLVLFDLSGSMENAVTQKTKTALLNLSNIAPKLARVVGDDGVLFDRSVKEIQVDTKLLIRAGEIVPLDGLVIEGSSFVNLVHLTGESRPLPKLPGDTVPAGARNLEGTLTIQVSKTSGDSTLSKLISLITQAHEAKPKLEKFLERFGKWYALSIISIAFILALTIPLIFSLPYLGQEGGIYRALAFLIAASPCALIIATPTAYLSSISSCAKRGILLKGGVVLDALASCKLIAFDKTGTLTTGKLTCLGIEPINTSFDPNLALAIAASLERNAVHPIAEAICTYATEKKQPFYPIKDFKVVPGYGVEALVELPTGPLSVYLGNATYISKKVPLMQKGKETLLLIGDDLFSFSFSDSVRPQIKETLEQLRTKHNFRVMMLTGDHVEHAERVAEELGIDEVHADLRPEDKLRKVTELASQGLVMVGDGINDAPALARATVGISLGKIGSATAVDASDIVFLQDDLTQLSWLVNKSKKTLSIIKQNLTLALGIIVIATTPAVLGFIPLWLAVILHEGGTVLVGLNSLRLLKSK